MKAFKSVFSVVTFMAIFFCSLFVFAQITAPTTVDGATSLIPNFIVALTAGNYNVAGGILLMVLMVAFRQFAVPKLNLNTNALPIVSAIIAAISMAALSLASGVAMGDALKTGLTMSIFAGGTWGLIGKYVAKLILGDKYQESDPSATQALK